MTTLQAGFIKDHSNHMTITTQLQLFKTNSSNITIIQNQHPYYINQYGHIV
jgi:hypothetical protein